MSRMQHVTPRDVYYWCPSGSSAGHFHSRHRGYTCEACGVEIYDARDGTVRWKARLPHVYIIAEDDELLPEHNVQC